MALISKKEVGIKVCEVHPGQKTNGAVRPVQQHYAYQDEKNNIPTHAQTVMKLMDASGAASSRRLEGIV